MRRLNIFFFTLLAMVALGGFAGCTKKTSSFSRNVVIEPILDRRLVAENAPIGTEVGTLSAKANFPDIKGPFVFELASPAKDSLVAIVDGDKVVLTRSPDFETDSATPQIPIKVSQIGGGNSSVRNIELQIEDINEAPTDITLSNKSFYANEMIGFVVGTLDTIDPDNKAQESFHYELVASSMSDIFAIESNGNSHKLVLKNTVAQNIEASAVMTVKATDKGGLSIPGNTKDFQIQIKRYNYAPENLKFTASAEALTEDDSTFKVVGTFSATDRNLDDQLRYRILGQGICTTNDCFTIDATTGVLKTAKQLTAYRYKTIVTKVEVSDGEKVVVINTNITVQGINHAPKNLSYSGSNKIIDGSLSAGATVGTLSALDQDAGDIISYSLESGSDAWFALVGNKLIWKGIAFNTSVLHSVKVVAKDQLGAFVPLTIDIKLVAIGIDDLDQFKRSEVKKVDIVWVMDNSSSMTNYQIKIQDKFSSFIDGLSQMPNLDYRMAITTTDVDKSNDNLFPYITDGRFMNVGLGLNPSIALPLKQYKYNATRLSSTSTTRSELEANFKADIKVGEDGSGLECGLLAGVLSLARATPTAQPIGVSIKSSQLEQFNQSFFVGREDAELVFIVVSDEDESTFSTGNTTIKDMWGLNTFTLAENEIAPWFVNEIRNYAQILKPTVYSDILDNDYRSNDVFIHTIVKTNATRYRAAADLTGGLKLDILTNDYGPLLQNLSENFLRLKVKFILNALPDPTTLVIEVTDESGTVHTYGYQDMGTVFTLDGKKLIFKDAFKPSEGASIKITYEKI